MNWHTDWGTMGQNFGCYARCGGCFDNVFNSSDEENYDSWKVKPTFNAVVIGNGLPKEHGTSVFGHLTKKKKFEEDASIPEEEIIDGLNEIHGRARISYWEKEKEAINGIRR
jgi:hypothetical protein